MQPAILCPKPVRASSAHTLPRAPSASRPAPSRSPASSPHPYATHSRRRSSISESLSLPGHSASPPPSDALQELLAIFATSPLPPVLAHPAPPSTSRPSSRTGARSRNSHRRSGSISSRAPLVGSRTPSPTTVREPLYSPPARFLTRNPLSRIDDASLLAARLYRVRLGESGEAASALRSAVEAGKPEHEQRVVQQGPTGDESVERDGR